MQLNVRLGILLNLESLRLAKGGRFDNIVPLLEKLLPLKDWMLNKRLLFRANGVQRGRRRLMLLCLPVLRYSLCNLQLVYVLVGGRGGCRRLLLRVRLLSQDRLQIWQALLVTIGGIGGSC
ncbi:uncharacterized protein LOC115768412 [Drosophila novamexicana]|uniref:uncharacterized protein LOC115768411 n=1 Tax=Drosophila novamexicana TaxID=47314 RepID=UPI0011E5A138|nr:uncharacterized protein LOC115768411 [Drosophila novamexicana]XP_030568842.1 uncharacterized protein LOC115768412 [Drosophila novamexicana]